MRKIGVVLLAASSLFLLWSSNELFIITPKYGPEMEFFSRLHGWSKSAIVVLFVSALFYHVLVGYILIVVVARLAVRIWRLRSAGPGSGSKKMTRFGRLILWFAGPLGRSQSFAIWIVSIVILFHFLSLWTYGVWSSAF